ncbi:MAG: MGMT family protein [Candidatus Hermodarchaeota archaeon]
MPTNFTQDVIKIIKSIPVGKVLTYGKIAKLAGNPRAARQVSWLLHSSSKKHNLPWHRVINSQGKIVLKSEDGKDFQKVLLESEGIEFVEKDRVDLKKYLWEIDSLSNI